MDRRSFIRNTAIAAGGISLMGSNALALPADPPFSLPTLPYAFDALEPVIDRKTMEIHHGKHHKAYVDNLNKTLAELNLKAGKIEDFFPNASSLDPRIRNNSGGHYNHSRFWNWMAPDAKRQKFPSAPLAEAISAQFGTLDQMQTRFNEAALKIFGSGWAWLVLTPENKLEITTTPNQDNPLMDTAKIKGTPLIGLDVWEHAYYLQYQNRRVDYIKAWWNVVEWKNVQL